MRARKISPTIPELDLIDEIEALAEEYAERHGRLPVNVSHWDPSEGMVGRLRAGMPVSARRNPVFSNYSYFLGSHARVRAKLGISASAYSLFLENGSSAIMAVATAGAVRRVGSRRYAALLLHGSLCALAV
jgi:hypothetical protein